MATFEWEILDDSRPWLKLCADAWVDLAQYLGERGECLSGRPEFTTREDGARLWLCAEANVNAWPPGSAS